MSQTIFSTIFIHFFVFAFDIPFFLVSLKRQTILLLLINLFLLYDFISKFIYLYVFVGVKRVTWPPEHEYQARAASVTRQSPAFQPQVSEHMHIFETISFSSSGRISMSMHTFLKSYAFIFEYKWISKFIEIFQWSASTQKQIILYQHVF